ncbi:hypothetical protein PENTCL1PPCAC_10500, partial [Pristionchus entomophagus]
FLSGPERGVFKNGASERRQLKFHSVHGKHIQREDDGKRVVRTKSFCHGIAFSDRPIAIDEKVRFRQSEVTREWSGVLRIGVTNVDPAKHRSSDLPRFSCPTLSEKPGYWVKALPDWHAQEGVLVQFSVSLNGDIHYSINGENKDIFLSGVNTSSPLWAIIDVYGTAKAVEFERPLVPPVDESIWSMSSAFSRRFRVASPPPALPRSPTATQSPTVTRSPTVLDRTPSLRGALSLFGSLLGGGAITSSRAEDDRRPATSTSTSASEGRRVIAIPAAPRIPAPATPVARPCQPRAPASSSPVVQPPARTSSVRVVTPSSSSSS